MLIPWSRSQRVLGGLAIGALLTGDFFLETSSPSPTTVVVVLVGFFWILPNSCQGFPPSLLPPSTRPSHAVSPRTTSTTFYAEQKNTTSTSTASTSTSTASTSTLTSSLAQYLFREVTEGINELTGKEQLQPGDLLHWLDQHEPYKKNITKQ
jgi:hypothetical protein